MIAAAALIIGGTAFAQTQQNNAKPAATTVQPAPAHEHAATAQKKEVKEEKMEKKEATNVKHETKKPAAHKSHVKKAEKKEESTK